MAIHQVQIQAPIDVVQTVLNDIGGWRMWNCSVAFAALDGECVTGALGMIYLRRLSWLRWRFLVEQPHAHQLKLACRCFGVGVLIDHRLSVLDAQQTLLHIDVQSSGVLSRFLHINTVLPMWRDYQHDALQGIEYAAQEVYAASLAVKQ